MRLKSVYISKCTDIYTNLALEDWLYKHLDVNTHALMLWQNQPCVVIGRHQNPWLESNVFALPQLGAKLARRNSGGGTVYHDLGNLNLTFFTPREDYGRRRNLELISRSLKQSFNISTYINKREDLCIDDHKISGTASKLGRTTAYHHCTLLVDANKANISLALKQGLGTVKTNATVSIRSKIMNLTEVYKNIRVNDVLDSIILEYSPKECHTIDKIDDGHFPGVEDMKKIYLSDEWRYERTPKFTIYRDIGTNIQAYLVVDKGRCGNMGIESKINFTSDLLPNFNDREFNHKVLEEFESVVDVLRQECTKLYGNNKDYLS